MLPTSFLLPHLGGCGRSVEGAAPGCPAVLFCCRTLVVAGTWHPPTATLAAARVARSEAECAGPGGQALRSSAQRQPPQFCELRRSSPDNSQCTPHSVGDRQVWSAPIRKTPAFPPTGPAGQLCGKKRFSLPPGATHSLFQEKREWGAQSRRASPAPPPRPGTGRISAPAGDSDRTIQTEG